MKPITISKATITVNNQPVVYNSVPIAEVVAAKDGWLVIHNDNGSGGIVLPGIIGKTQISAGVNTNVVVQLDTANTYTPGQKLFPMVHLNTGVKGTYEFDGSSGLDLPEIFGNDPFPGNVIFTTFLVQ